MKGLLELTLLTLLSVTAALVLPGVSKTQKPADAERVARGKYIVNFGGCTDCHTPLKFNGPGAVPGAVPDLTRLLSGHPEGTKPPPPNIKQGPWITATAGMTAWAGPWGVSNASNLTPDTCTGLGTWTEEKFAKAMRTAKHMGDGREIRPPMPWQSVAALSDEDIRAVYAYLCTIPPAGNRVPE